MGMKDYFALPDNAYGWTSLLLGVIGSILYATQLLFGWFGVDTTDRTLFSLICLIMLVMAISCAYVANNVKDLKNPLMTTLKIFGTLFVIAFIFIIVGNGVGMMLDTGFLEHTNTHGGFLFGIPQLTYITEADVNSITQWALGVQMIIKAFFLVIPFLIACWGGLSVLTADSIDEAEGGILAIVAAFVVVLVVWMFRLVGVILGTE